MTAQEAFTVQCPSCSAGFLIDPLKVPVAGIHARCSACSHVFLVDRPSAEPEVEAPPADAPAVPEALDRAEEGLDASYEAAAAPVAPEATGAADAGSEAPPADTAVSVPAEPEAATPETPTDAPRFGRQDPHDKASRLARVLVSDMISYNPDRYANALERDSLKEDFEDEVQKSWEEYVDQVGQELADSSSYFQDALNEILARGKRVF